MSDLISRASAIDAICNSACGSKFCGLPCDDVAALKALPSAQPERKTGKWTKISPASIYECSVCGQTVMTDDIEAYSYCHGCGVKMEVSE